MVHAIFQGQILERLTHELPSINVVDGNAFGTILTNGPISSFTVGIILLSFVQNRDDRTQFQNYLAALQGIIVPENDKKI